MRPLLPFPASSFRVSLGGRDLPTPQVWGLFEEEPEEVDLRVREDVALTEDEEAEEG